MSVKKVKGDEKLHPYKNSFKSWLNFKVMLWYTWYRVRGSVCSEVQEWKDAFKRLKDEM